MRTTASDHGKSKSQIYVGGSWTSVLGMMLRLIQTGVWRRYGKKMKMKKRSLVVVETAAFARVLEMEMKAVKKP